MKTEYKYIRFIEVLRRTKERRKTEKYVCRNTSDEFLGELKWHTGWRQYCWFQDVDIIMSRGCLEDVAEFIGQLMDARKVHNTTERS